MSMIEEYEESDEVQDSTNYDNQSFSALSSGETTNDEAFTNFNTTTSVTSDEDLFAEPPTKIPNISSEHSKIVASHYNNLQEKGLYERSKSNIFYMRNFNNWIKSMLINEYLTKIKDNAPHGAPLRVLDMCCGKGGDLLKWEKGSITHLICTDIADVSVEQCQKRYATMAERAQNGRNKFQKMFSAEFFASDCTRNRIREQFKDVSIKLNLVSCQFSFHYCFESLKQAECMIRNAAECLAEGGFFIGTIPDANEIIRRQRESGLTSFGNDVYKISFLCDSKCPPLFGAKYNFQLEGVVDCPEFLVHFPMLIKLARKFGLEFVMKERFEDFYKKNLDQGKGLLERMNALETYPSHHNSNNGGNENYSHVAKKFDRNTKCGTVSKSEWEAISLYLVFAFRKMKTEWDDKGNPKYV
ncbi:mRNA cap guanine-N7 methyltransferase [Pseudolycoriella hygida]|uniref:mRNA cap guanine-N(7) methyltransferase n=1 Tax=Pseudolycoriella hygida TaxID=35572 RepID=A0A9Q0RUU4_9DIPT|nr:mRNA cap guanine-N7 methyltransferase [Pseudolycoriella hygida]